MRLHNAEDWYGGLPEVSTRTLRAFGLMFAHCDLDANYIKLAPVSAIDVSDGVSSSGRRLVGAILGGGITTLEYAAGITRGGLQIGLEILKEFAATT